VPHIPVQSVLLTWGVLCLPFVDDLSKGLVQIGEKTVWKMRDTRRVFFGPCPMYLCEKINGFRGGEHDLLSPIPRILTPVRESLTTETVNHLARGGQGHPKTLGDFREGHATRGLQGLQDEDLWKGHGIFAHEGQNLAFSMGNPIDEIHQAFTKSVRDLVGRRY
jgi:hypothetical protein